MGFKTEFNWALKLKPENGLDEAALKEGGIFEFSKDEYRTYPIDQPLDLINRNWEVLARVVVIEATCANKKTVGKYRIIKIYSKNEREVLTQYWREIVQIKKGEKIDNFFDVKVS